MLNICAKFHENWTCTYFSTNHNKRNEQTNKQTNKQTRVMAIYPDGGNNKAIRLWWNVEETKGKIIIPNFVQLPTVPSHKPSRQVTYHVSPVLLQTTTASSPLRCRVAPSGGSKFPHPNTAHHPLTSSLLKIMADNTASGHLKR